MATCLGIFIFEDGIVHAKQKDDSRQLVRLGRDVYMLDSPNQKDVRYISTFS
jgi:hypothetical protein